MTENELRGRVLEQAERWLGCREGDERHAEILAVYNAITPLPRGYRMTASDPWCAAFVSAAGAAAGLGEIVFPECGCGPMLERYAAAGRFEENDEAVPRPGDVIFYDWDDPGEGDCSGAPEHVGLVESVKDDWLSLLEGNLSDRVRRRTLRVGARFIRGYGKPDYLGLSDYCPQSSAEAESCHPERSAAGAQSCASADAMQASKRSQGGSWRAAKDLPDSSDNAFPLRGRCPSAHTGADEVSSQTGTHTDAAIRSSSVSLPTLRRGDTGETVRAAQLLLIGRGCRCGPWGADGDFGPATCGGVFTFQRRRGLAVDGIVGPRTWAALLGL